MTTRMELNPIDAIEVSVTAIEPSATVEQIAETYQRVQWLKARTKELEQNMEDRLIAYIKERGDITLAVDGQGNEKRLYLAHPKSVKCVDVRKVVQTLVELGDWDSAMACLSSSAIKHGAVRKLLVELKEPELFDVMFVTEVRDKLETGEPAPKQLQSFDSRFSK